MIVFSSSCSSSILLIYSTILCLFLQCHNSLCFILFVNNKNGNSNLLTFTSIPLTLKQSLLSWQKNDSITSKSRRRRRRRLTFLFIQNKSHDSSSVTTTTTSSSSHEDDSILKEIENTFHHSTPSLSTFSCQHCSRVSFSSRNALFRHLRQYHNSNNHSIINNNNNNNNQGEYYYNFEKNIKKSVVLLFTYDSFLIVPTSTTNTPFIPPTTITRMNMIKTEVEQIGDAIQEAFLYALQQYYNTNHKNNTTQQVQILSSTQCTVPRMRHGSLFQETGCSSCGDVLSIAYNRIISLNNSSSSQEKEEEEEESNQDEMDRLHIMLRIANQYLTTHYKLIHIITSSSSSMAMIPTTTTTTTHSTMITSQVSQIQILAATPMPYTKYFHTEKACTQKAYHYLIPLEWLPEGKEIEKWKLSHSLEVENKTTTTTSTTPTTSSSRMKTIFGLSKRWEKTVIQPPPSSTLKVLKMALRTVESTRWYNHSTTHRVVSTTTTTRTTTRKNKLAMGRYGSLAYKEKKCWHNYADPTLQGAISPNHEPVWRVIDTCRIVQLLTYDHKNKKQVMALIEVRGDDFLPQQVRRIIATTIAITYGWLPTNFIEYSTRPDVFIETPIAPLRRLYFAGARFHWEELENEGRDIFDHYYRKNDNHQQEQQEEEEDTLEKEQSSSSSSIIETQRRLLNRCQDYKEDEYQWLEELRDVIAPRIRMQMDQQQQVSSHRFLQRTSEQSTTDGRVIPPSRIYMTTLSILRHIKNQGLWPTTSSARSKVIKNVGENNAGSFTVLNPTFQDGILFHEHHGYNYSIPLGNVLFPDLVQAVFDLERILSMDLQQNHDSSPYRRENVSSSHCAINCNAQFNPHVDSGRGSGQSLSLIVGLGDYQGGEIFVEGVAHDIQYKPLEFNGWRQRHWTGNFQGERFSLVWFTPEMTNLSMKVPAN